MKMAYFADVDWSAVEAQTTEAPFKPIKLVDDKGALTTDRDSVEPLLKKNFPHFRGGSIELLPG